MGLHSLPIGMEKGIFTCCRFVSQIMREQASLKKENPDLIKEHGIKKGGRTMYDPYIDIAKFMETLQLQTRTRIHYNEQDCS